MVDTRETSGCLWTLTLVVVVVVVLNKAYYVHKNSLCGLINNILMQYDILSSLVIPSYKNVVQHLIKWMDYHHLKTVIIQIDYTISTDCSKKIEMVQK